MKFVFLTYLNRSGSTLLAKKLSKYKEVGVGIEANLIDGIKNGNFNINSEIDLDNYLDTIYEDTKFSSWNISKKDLKRSLLNNFSFPIKYEDFLETAFDLYFYNKRKKLYIHKEGRYYNYIEALKEHFDDAKFIFINRDPRAIFSSQKRTLNSKDKKPMQLDIVKFAIAYKKSQSIIKNHSNKNDLIEIYYENLLKNEAKELGKLIKFLNIRTEISKDDYFNRIPREQKHLHDNLQNDNNITDRINGWKEELSKWEIKFLEKVLEAEILINGYKFENINLRSNYYSYYISYIQFLIINFVKNIKYFIRKYIYGN